MNDEEVNLKYISRIDTNDTHGWYVRIERNGLTFRKLFSDKKLGSRDWALIQAILYSDECIEKIEFKASKTESVSLKRVTKYSRGYAYDVFEVSWPHSNHIKKKSYSIKKFGEKDAFEKATRWAANVRKQLNLL